MLQRPCLFFILSCVWMASCQQSKEVADEQSGLQIAENGRFFTQNGDPFFWLGDTGWLIFKKLTRDEVIQYLDDRQVKGYNVIQVMLLHNVEAATIWDAPALVDGDAGQPYVTPGSNPLDSTEYDYWDHVEFTIQEAEKRDLYMGLVPIWGSPVSDGKVTPEQAKSYTRFLYDRFGKYPNIIWLNGGDVRGDDHPKVWQAIGRTLDSLDQEHLITFHPRGRTMSSEWFHSEPWMDFNMFQSGHRSYEQDTASDSHRFGPDNWRYIEVEFAKTPVKPTLDGEPSYEGIPYGLHDPNLPYWGASDLRRYAYWSVFAGGAGFTYGHNSVMQFFNARDNGRKSFGAREFWTEALDHPGAGQMVHLKKLMLSRSYFDRVPAQELIADQGERYEYQVATKGKDYAMIYTYTGREIGVAMDQLGFRPKSASWFNPRTGEESVLKEIGNGGTVTFDPPGDIQEGNDWVLILDK